VPCPTSRRRAPGALRSPGLLLSGRRRRRNHDGPADEIVRGEPFRQLRAMAQEVDDRSQHGRPKTLFLSVRIVEPFDIEDRPIA